MEQKKQIELENEPITIHTHSIQASSPLEMGPHNKARIVIGLGEGSLQCKSHHEACAPFIFENKKAYWIRERLPHTLFTHDPTNIEVIIIEIKEEKEKNLWPSIPLD